MRMTFMDIENTDKFFDLLKKCTGPVTVNAGGRSEDLRDNTFLHTLLKETSKNGRIARLELHVEEAHDLPIFCHYLMGGYGCSGEKVG